MYYCAQGKAEDAGALTGVKDDNAAMHSPVRRTCEAIFPDCYGLLLRHNMEQMSTLFSAIQKESIIRMIIILMMQQEY